MVTHDQEEALSMADRVVVMNHGTIEQVGTPQRRVRAAGDAVRRRFPRQGQRAEGDVRLARAAIASATIELTTTRRPACAPARRCAFTCGRRIAIVDGDIAAMPNRLRGASRTSTILGTFCLAELDCRRLRGQPMTIAYSRSTSCTSSACAKAAKSSSHCAATASACSAAATHPRCRAHECARGLRRRRDTHRASSWRGGARRARRPGAAGRRAAGIPDACRSR